MTEDSKKLGNNLKKIRTAKNVTQIEIAKKLLQDAALPFQKRDELDKVLTIIDEIAQTVPAYQFGFRPDQSALDYFQCFI